MIKQFRGHIRVTFVAPEREVSEAQSDGVLLILVMGHHMRLNVSATANVLASQTHPVLFGVPTDKAGRVYSNVLEFGDIQYVFMCAVGALVYRRHCEEAHQRTLLRLFELFLLFFRLCLLDLLIFSFSFLNLLVIDIESFHLFDKI